MRLCSEILVAHLDFRFTKATDAEVHWQAFCLTVSFGNALQAASYRGHGKVVQLLLEKGSLGRFASSRREHFPSWKAKESGYFRMLEQTSIRHRMENTGMPCKPHYC